VHEYSLIQSLVERVEAEARARSAIAVHCLNVRIGELSGVDAELFKTAYLTFRERTVCEGAELHIEIVPVQWACEGCGRPIDAGQPLQCVVCSRPARLVGGDEIVLDRIEMEVGDV
jgi:hydrogenase nickel incorporation protein HypA/HybF